jgi:sugar lactone lactonase YvrE
LYQTRQFFFSFAALLVCGLWERPAAAHPAWGIVIDPGGRVIFSEVETNTIWRIENGRPVPILRGKHSHEITIDGEGNLYGEHLEYRPAGERWVLSLWQLTPDGREVQIQPPTDTVALPQGLGPLRDRQGNTYAFRGPFQRVNEVVLYRRSPAGEAVALAGGPPGHADGRGAAARFTGIQGKAFAPGGDLYVTDGGTVRRITPEGVVTTLGGDPLAGVGHGERPRLLGLAVDQQGQVFVADYDHRSVREIGLDGRVREPWRSGSFWAPTGVMAAGGSLYILETRPEMIALPAGPLARVWRLGADGSKTLLATVGQWNPAVSWIALIAMGVVASLLAGLLARRRRTSPAVR